MPGTPLVHGAEARLVEIDGLCADEGGAVVVHDVEGGVPHDLEDGAHRVEGPVGGGTADLAVLERGAHGALGSVFDVVTLVVSVGGGSDA